MTKREVTMAFIAACMGMAFFGVTMVALGSVLPDLSLRLGLADAQKASLAMVLTLGIFAGSIVFGPVCDRFGHRGIFLASCVLVLVGILGIATAESYSTLIAAYLCIGTGGGVLNGQTNTLASDLYDESRRGARLSLLGAFYGVGGIGITFLMAAFGQMVGYQVILYGIAAVLVVCLAFCFTITFPKPKQAQSFPIKDAVKMLADPVLIIFSLVLMLESSVESITNNLSTTYFSHFDNVVFLLTVNMIGITLARFVMAWMASKMSQQTLLYTFLTLLLAGFVILSMASTFAIAVVAMAIIGMGTAATYPVVLGQLGNRYTSLSGTAFGMAITIALAGNTVMNMLVGGWLMGIYPYMMMLFTALMISLFTVGRKLAKKKD